MKIGAVIAASLRKLAVPVAVGAACLTLATSASAGTSGAAYYSFGATNCILPSTAINSWPTNSGTTNLIGPVGSLTGGAINIQYVDEFVLRIVGQTIGLTTTGTNVIGVGIVTACPAGGSTPQVTLGTNAYTLGVTNVVYNDFCLNTNWYVFTLPQPSTTNQYFNVQQSVNNTSLPALGTWIGIASITNNGFVAGFVTNLDIGIQTKILVKPFAP